MEPAMADILVPPAEVCRKPVRFPDKSAEYRVDG
jgi:hypothetical protein